MKQQSLNMSAEIDTSRLPLDVRAKLAELELELSDGDITQKGYEKKRAKLLDPYMGRQQPPNTQAQSQPQAQSQSRPKDASPDDSSGGSPRIRRPRHHRRDDLRYQSDIRTEAVQAALAKHRESAGPSTGGGAGNHSGSSSTAMPLAAVRRQPSSAMTQSTMGAAAFASADREHYSEEDASAGSGSDLGDDDDKEVAVDDRHPADGEHSTLDDASPTAAGGSTSAAAGGSSAAASAPDAADVTLTSSDSPDSGGVDANAPRPQGEESRPAVGESLITGPGAAASLEESLIQARTQAVACLELSGKLSNLRQAAKQIEEAGLHSAQSAGASRRFELVARTRTPSLDEAPPLCASATGFLLSSLVECCSEAFIRTAPKAVAAAASASGSTGTSADQEVMSMSNHVKCQQFQFVGDITPASYMQQPPNTQAQSQPQAQSQSRPKDASPDDSSGGSPRIRRPRHHRRDDLRYQSDIRTEAVQAALAKHRESAGPSTGGGAGNHSGSSSTAMPLAAVRRQPSSAMTQSTMGAAAFASADREHYSEEDASAGSGSDLGDDDDKEVAVDDRHPADGEHSTLDDASPTAAGGSTSAAAGGSSAAASAPDAADVTLTSSDSPDSGGVDANAPRPQGEESRPAVGESLITGPGAAASLEESLMRAAAGPQARTQAVACLELSGKLSSCLTFAKLLNRSKKLAYTLLNRLGHRGDSSLKPGDRVAIAVPNSDPVSFVIAFLASQFAGLVPVPVEAPPLCASATGFLLSSLDIRVLLTTEAFIRTAPKAVAAAASASGSTGTSASGGGSDQLTYPGWPRSLFWALVDANQSNPPKDWQPPSLQSGGLDPASLAYVEYAWGRDGSVRGVCVSRGAALAHTRSIGAACGYASGESLVCLVDPKRELGLWHAVLAAAYYGMSVVFVPYAVMKQDPSCWLRLVSKQRIGVALAKSRDLYWSLLTQRDHREVNLNSLRCLLVADGANPWSLTSCDSFLSVFQPRGLRPEALCPCAYSCESLTVALRRPAGSGAATSGRGVLSMQGLSHGVVRVDSENSYTSLTLQDCGLVMPAGAVAVVRLAPAQPFLCRQDEVGEICVSARYAAHKYWGLAGLSNQVFRCQPLTAATGAPISDREVFVRTGLLGFLGPPSSGGLVFVCGSLEGLMTVAGRRHNSDDLIATVLAVEPLKFVFRGRIAVFSQRILNDERIIIAAEQRPDANEDQCFQWMSHVLQAVDSIHQVRLLLSS
uniref:DMAP-interaction domain-containing protein n=1 Tax=Macrostomum lignano TaxID=282301 RepID=A0A1I8GW11_9PLAT